MSIYMFRNLRSLEIDGYSNKAKTISYELSNTYIANNFSRIKCVIFYKKKDKFMFISLIYIVTLI